MLPKIKTITNEETIELIKQYRMNDDIDIRNKIILGNMGLIYSLAHRYPHQDFDDFVSEGVIGIIDAINRFDVSMNNRFSTYAYWRILKKVNQSIFFGALGMPQHRITIFKDYEKAKAKIVDAGGTPNTENIAEDLGISPHILIDIINQKTNVSLDTPKSDFSGLHNTISFEDSLIDAIDFERTKKIINSVLTDKEHMVLNYRFGLEDYDALTLQETSEKVNISTEGVRQMQNKSLKKLRRASTRKRF